jgi:hypothetical protein
MRLVSVPAKPLGIVAGSRLPLIAEPFPVDRLAYCAFSDLPVTGIA